MVLVIYQCKATGVTKTGLRFYEEFKVLKTDQSSWQIHIE